VSRLRVKSLPVTSHAIVALAGPRDNALQQTDRPQAAGAGR